MRNIALACGILVSVVSVSLGTMSKEELEKTAYDCYLRANLGADINETDFLVKKREFGKNACQALIDNGLPSVEQCDKECSELGFIYYIAEHYIKAVSYYKKAITLGDESAYLNLANVYGELGDIFNSNKYNKIGCNKGVAGCCFNLAQDYIEGKNIIQNYHKAAELYKKACDMKYGGACNNLGVLYQRGKGVRQNPSTAKQYYGKACDFGDQTGCDNYKGLHNRGVQ